MNFNTLCICGFEPALKGMRLPLKSQNKADSYYEENGSFVIGPNDYKLMKGLWKGGTEHRKYLRQIQVWAEITAPRYWWSEYDTYRIGTNANSESTMHTILKEPFDTSQFEWPPFTEADRDIQAAFNDYIDILKTVRDRANKKSGENKEQLQRVLKSMLPESFLQKREVVSIMKY